MSKQLLLIAPNVDLEAVPSPKVRTADRSGVHGWTNFYASFSERFVTHALVAMGATEMSSVYDPFVGSGTTAVCAAKLGMRSIGADIDPFACLLSRAKIAVRADFSIVSDLLRPGRRRHTEHEFVPEALDVFSGDCLGYAGAIFRNVQRRTGVARSAILKALLHDSTGEYDSEVVAVAGVCIAATRAAKLVRGSNPTWYRPIKKGERLEVAALRSATVETIRTMLMDLGSLAMSVRARCSIVHNVDARHWPESPQTPFADFVVTSPPYLTRIDYVVKHLPNLLLLSGLTDIRLDALRSRMVGTSKILGKIDSMGSSDLGPRAEDLIARIRDHSSYASARYYRWIHQQYLTAMQGALGGIVSATKPGGSGIVVVQDSFYKDVYIDLGEIIVEMLSQLSIPGTVIRSEPIKTNLRQLNPRRPRNTPVAKERVIYFRKPSART